MENNPVLLKSSVFGGFKKKDVLSYIFELNETTQEERQKLAEQVEELVQSRDNLAASVGEMERKIAELQSNLDDAAARLEEETSKNEDAEELIEKLKSEISNHEITVSQQKSELESQMELNSKLSEKSREYEKKRDQVELAASQIADLLGQARIDADNVIERAKLEAENLIKDAKLEAENTVKSAKDSIESHVDEANKSMDDAYKKFGDFRSELEDLHKTILGVSDSITEKMQSVKDRVLAIEKLAPEKLSADSLPTLQYEKDDTDEARNAGLAASVTVDPSVAEEADNMTKDILLRYGVRKDDSGFFRLASDK